MCWRLCRRKRTAIHKTMVGLFLLSFCCGQTVTEVREFSEVRCLKSGYLKLSQHTPVGPKSCHLGNSILKWIHIYVNFIIYIYFFLKENEKLDNSMLFIYNFHVFMRKN